MVMSSFLPGEYTVHLLLTEREYMNNEGARLLCQVLAQLELDSQALTGQS